MSQENKKQSKLTDNGHAHVFTFMPANENYEVEIISAYNTTHKPFYQKLFGPSQNYLQATVTEGNITKK